MRSPISPLAFLSGALTFGLLMLQSLVAMSVLPHLGDLFRQSPRLAMMVILGLITLPGWVVLAIHHIGIRFIEKDRSYLPTYESWWAAALAWMTMYGTTVLMQIIMLVIDPPPPEGEGFATSMMSALSSTLAHASPANAVSVFAGLWILIASVIYELERRSRKG